MRPITNCDGTKKATNLSINRDLLAEALDLKINLSATLEEALQEKVRETRRNSGLRKTKKR